MSIEGGCFCGAVRYRAGAQPLASMICHCRTCRRISGAPAVAWVSFASHDFAFVSGEPRRWHSSPGVVRHFCHACGTPLTYQRDDEPDGIDVTTCTLDDVDACAPTHHSWLAHDLAWLRFGDGLPAFRRARNDG
jgi:hypothetical protein